MDKIDILMATYNGQEFLREQIDSILNQTYSNFRLLISDDCSKDDTRKILEEYKQKDNRIEVYFQKENLGYVKNFEYLLNQVDSEYYMLSDQDDYWLPEKVEKTLEKLKKENADFVFGDLEVVDQNLNMIYPSFWNLMKLNKKINKYIDSYKINYLYNCVTGCTILAKKQTLNKILPIPNDSKYLIHDHWMGIMAGIYGKLAYIPEKYIKYRQHGENQVGVNKVSHGFSEMDQVRKLFIDVKLGIFGTYVKNENRFPDKYQKANREAYEYFQMVENKKTFNFKKWNVFHRLYKTESFTYYILNFIIMNMPALGRPLFKIRYYCLKMLKKR